ncbi:MAG: nucleotidyl transferase AbiEii/AbiGii toxin family protein [Bacilli bacterium]|nr:nucleotidyl transferase AbiEii/AbiGii toxin family protein [Bacilli bacterium]
MSNSAQAVKDKLKNISKDKNVDFNSVMRFYMYDRFVERLSKSKYKDNFILKGGFYLCRLFGFENRSTMDIDTAVRKANFTEENIVKMVTEIIDIDVNDNVKFKIEKISAIKDEDEYGGLRVTINFSLENIKDKFYIDIATGDPIHPGPDDFNYESLLGNEVYKVWSYNLETVLAEKIETILSKLETSSRMKDYYDIYLIHKFKFNKINKTNLRGAVEKTFEKRKFNVDIITNLNIVKDSNVLREKWISYAKKNSYAKDLDFDETIKCLEDFIKVLI